MVDKTNVEITYNGNEVSEQDGFKVEYLEKTNNLIKLAIVLPNSDSDGAVDVLLTTSDNVSNTNILDLYFTIYYSI